MSDLNELKDIAYLANEAGQGSPAMVEFRVSATPDVVIVMINQLEAAQQRIAELEAELSRRDAAAGEPVAWQVYAAVFTDKENATRWAIAERHEVIPLYAAAQPSALPSEVTYLDGPYVVINGEYNKCWAAGANWMRQKAKALCCKAIKLPSNVISDVYYSKKQVIESLKAQGFTVEGE